MNCVGLIFHPDGIGRISSAIGMILVALRASLFEEFYWGLLQLYRLIHPVQLIGILHFEYVNIILGQEGFDPDEFKSGFCASFFYLFAYGESIRFYFLTLPFASYPAGQMDRIPAFSGTHLTNDHAGFHADGVHHFIRRLAFLIDSLFPCFYALALSIVGRLLPCQNLVSLFFIK